MNKPKNSNKNPERDNFGSPNYIVKKCIQYMPNDIKIAWDGSAGKNGHGQIVKNFQNLGYECIGTDINTNDNKGYFDYLSDDVPNFQFQLICQNVPFSKKISFWKKTHWYITEYDRGLKAALLVPADYSAWIMKAVDLGWQKLVPKRRVSYITPNMYDRILWGELFKLGKKENIFPKKAKQSEYKKELEVYAKQTSWHDIFNNLYHGELSNISNELLYKYSQSQFHSMWLCWGFNFPREEMRIDLNLEEMKDIL